MEISLEDFDDNVDMEISPDGDVKDEIPLDEEKTGILSGDYASEKEAYEMYCQYAHNAGFSVRKDHHSYWPNSRKIKSKDFVCSRAGFKRGIDLNSQTKYRKSNTRTGCPAMVRFSVSLDGVWTVKKCIDNHNHELARPADQHLLRSCRNISEENASVLRSMTEVGIGIGQAFSYLRDEAGGAANLGFSKRDAYNLVQRDRRSKVESGDANALLELFRDRQLHDDMFSWDVETDDKDKLLNIFWVDGMGRIDYDCFGDVLIFDTSYRLNKYNLACAPIVGVNQHWQNVLLGVGFLSEETIEAFTWLFKTFVRIMGGKHPITIFTDQDQAMARAIEIALPNTCHRLCQWHIFKKAPSKVSCYNSNKKVKDLFYRCLSKCDSEEEFEGNWAEMISEGELQSNEWLKDLYRIREKWSTAFNKDCFNLGILTTQRSESTNNVCHGVSKATSSLTECFLGMEKLVTNWRRNEQDEEFKRSQSEIVPLVRSSTILKQAARFYSRKLYSFFEEEFLQGVGGLCIFHASCDSTTFFVRSVDQVNGGKHWTVHFETNNGNIECSCGKFKMMGILCCHCMRVFRQLDIVEIPRQYLMARWSAAARKEYFAGQTRLGLGLGSKSSGECGSNGSTMMFRNHISRFAYQISSRASGNDDAEQYVMSAMVELSENVDFIIHGKQTNTRPPPKTSLGVRKTVLDPSKRRPKGITNARLKSAWEKGKKRKSNNVKNSSIPTKESHSQPPNQTRPSQPPNQINSSLPACLTEEYVLRRPSSQPSEEYTRMMREIIDSERVAATVQFL